MTRCAALLGLGVLACAPLTFSNPGSIDFERYRVARIEGDMAQYLANQLNETSGFAAVTTDPTARVDLTIRVSLSVQAELRCENDCDCDCNCNCTLKHQATAAFTATAADGTLVDQGSENDSSAEADEAAEDALDEVALHYVRPYRL